MSRGEQEVRVAPHIPIVVFVVVGTNIKIKNRCRRFGLEKCTEKNGKAGSKTGGGGCEGKETMQMQQQWKIRQNNSTDKKYEWENIEKAQQ